MYVTRPLSHLIRFPETLSAAPDGPNSGYLVLQDKESETYYCFGLCKNRYLDDLPFPQNKKLTLYNRGSDDSHDDVLLIPALNLPLTSNHYYAIQPHGKHKGQAFTSSREEDIQSCCFCPRIRDVKPRPLDPNNLYQQFKISPYEGTCVGKGSFLAESVVPDSFPPEFFRTISWSIRAKTPKNYQIGDALGLNTSLRQLLPDFDFPISTKMSKAVVSGKWYCPFMFVKEGRLKDQMKRSIFYEMKLERKWEQIFTCQNSFNEGNSVNVDINVEREVAFVDGNKAVVNDSNVGEGVVWFISAGRGREKQSINVGLRVEIIERMKWEQERGGWLVVGESNEVRVHREEKFAENNGGWTEFGCYVLVESFVLKRMDGTLVMSYDFRHTHQIKSKWE